MEALPTMKIIAPKYVLLFQEQERVESMCFYGLDEVLDYLSEEETDKECIRNLLVYDNAKEPFTRSITLERLSALVSEFKKEQAEERTNEQGLISSHYNHANLGIN